MSNAEKSNKATYAQPKLSVYGGFAQLTAGGSTGTMEGGAMTNMMRSRI
ncbi:MAG: hypothetical protein ACKO1O_02675 [Erythrobacter sp.]